MAGVTVAMPCFSVRWHSSLGSGPAWGIEDLPHECGVDIGTFGPSCH